MKKSYIKYLLLIMILLALNVLCFIVAFSLYEISPQLNDVIDNSTILLFIISNMILYGFIRKCSLSVNKSVAIIFLLLLIVRIFEVFAFKSSLSLSYCSYWGIGTLLNIATSQGDDWVYWWTIIIFPMFQPLFILLFHKIITRRT